MPSLLSPDSPPPAPSTPSRRRVAGCSNGCPGVLGLPSGPDTHTEPHTPPNHWSPRTGLRCRGFFAHPHPHTPVTPATKGPSTLTTDSGRAVKEMDSKSSGLSPQGSESPCRRFCPPLPSARPARSAARSSRCLVAAVSPGQRPGLRAGAAGSGPAAGRWAGASALEAKAAKVLARVLAKPGVPARATYSRGLEPALWGKCPGGKCSGSKGSRSAGQGASQARTRCSRTLEQALWAKLPGVARGRCSGRVLG